MYLYQKVWLLIISFSFGILLGIVSGFIFLQFLFFGGFNNNPLFKPILIFVFAFFVPVIGGICLMNKIDNKSAVDQIFIIGIFVGFVILLNLQFFLNINIQEGL